MGRRRRLLYAPRTELASFRARYEAGPDASGFPASSLPTVEQLKALGNERFTRGEHAVAADAYSRALELAQQGSEMEALLHANRAQCYLKRNELDLAVVDASVALRGAPAHQKALYRRALALAAFGMYEDSLQDADKLSPAADYKSLRESLQQNRKFGEDGLKMLAGYRRSKQAAAVAEGGSEVASLTSLAQEPPRDPKVFAAKVLTAEDARVPDIRFVRDLLEIVFDGEDDPAAAGRLLADLYKSKASGHAKGPPTTWAARVAISAAILVKAKGLSLPQAALLLSCGALRDAVAAGEGGHFFEFFAPEVSLNVMAVAGFLQHFNIASMQLGYLDESGAQTAKFVRRFTEGKSDAFKEALLAELQTLLEFDAGDELVRLVRSSTLLSAWDRERREEDYGDWAAHVEAEKPLVRSRYREVKDMNDEADAMAPLRFTSCPGVKAALNRRPWDDPFGRELWEALRRVHAAAFARSARVVYEAIEALWQKEGALDFSAGTLLHTFCKVPAYEVVEFLLRAGADANQVDQHGWPVLKRIVWQRDNTNRRDLDDVMSLLLQAGAEEH
eukprot:tig00001127_g7141.t1